MSRRFRLGLFPGGRVDGNGRVMGPGAGGAAGDEHGEAVLCGPPSCGVGTGDGAFDEAEDALWTEMQVLRL